MPQSTTEPEPIALDPSTALMARQLQDALHEVTGINLSELEALMVASAIEWNAA